MGEWSAWIRATNPQTWPFGRAIINTLAGTPDMRPCYKLTVVPTMLSTSRGGQEDDF